MESWYKFTVNHWLATMKVIDPKFIDRKIKRLEQLLKKYPGGQEHRMAVSLLIKALDFKLKGDKYDVR